MQSIFCCCCAVVLAIVILLVFTYMHTHTRTHTHKHTKVQHLHFVPHLIVHSQVMGMKLILFCFLCMRIKNKLFSPLFTKDSRRKFFFSLGCIFVFVFISFVNAKQILNLILYLNVGAKKSDQSIVYLLFVVHEKSKVKLFIK